MDFLFAAFAVALCTIAYVGLQARFGAGAARSRPQGAAPGDNAIDAAAVGMLEAMRENQLTREHVEAMRAKASGIDLDEEF